MRYAFDLDGTLIDSQTAVLNAYLKAGVNPPPNFFVMPWRNWLQGQEAERLHALKNKIYVEQMIPHIKALPLMNLYKSMCGISWGADPVVLTGASSEAVAAIRRQFILHRGEWHCEMSVSDKIDWMNTEGKGIMFEDQLDAAKQMKEYTRWTICHTLS